MTRRTTTDVALFAVVFVAVSACSSGLRHSAAPSSTAGDPSPAATALTAAPTSTLGAPLPSPAVQAETTTGASPTATSERAFAHLLGARHRPDGRTEVWFENTNPTNASSYWCPSHPRLRRSPSSGTVVVEVVGDVLSARPASTAPPELCIGQVVSCLLIAEPDGGSRLVLADATGAMVPSLDGSTTLPAITCLDE